MAVYLDTVAGCDCVDSPAAPGFGQLAGDGDTGGGSEAGAATAGAAATVGIVAYSLGRLAAVGGGLVWLGALATDRPAVARTAGKVAIVGAGAAVVGYGMALGALAYALKNKV